MDYDSQLSSIDSSDTLSVSLAGIINMDWLVLFSKRERFLYASRRRFYRRWLQLDGTIGTCTTIQRSTGGDLDVEPEDDEMSNKIPDLSILEPHAKMLYGMIHQRFITTRAGLNQMYSKYKAGEFGYCPRYHCDRTKVLPCGQHDLPMQSTVRLYCPNCKDIYLPSNGKHSTIDGAHFGTTFPHLFVQTFPDILPPPTFEQKNYVAKLFGFRVNERSKSGPRMGWLRMTPPS
ncbi:unnamed protein product [Absidia cylindrospora]